MKLNEKLGIKEELLSELKKIFCKYDTVEKVVVFGSRAIGNFKYNSDMDICIYGKRLSNGELSKIIDEIDDLYTPLSFDVLNYEDIIKEELRENIQKDGVEIYVREKNN